MTKEEQKATIEALLNERKGYELRVGVAEEDGDPEKIKEAKARVAGVNEQLKALGVGAKKPSKRAQRRPAQKASSKR